jgi:hypothetical protein
MRNATKNPGAIHFNATIEPPKGVWGTLLGDVSLRPSETLWSGKLYGVGNSVPVVATVDKKGFRSGLWKKDRLFGRSYLWIPKRIWRRLRKAAGDTVSVTVAPDIERREVEVPQDLRVALSRNRVARASFKRLHRLSRGEYVDWINEAIQPASRKRRIARAVEMLAKAQTLRLRK